jgi:hypothetical protein
VVRGLCIRRNHNHHKKNAKPFLIAQRTHICHSTQMRMLIPHRKTGNTVEKNMLMSQTQINPQTVILYAQRIKVHAAELRATQMRASQTKRWQPARH